MRHALRHIATFAPHSGLRRFNASALLSRLANYCTFLIIATLIAFVSTPIPRNYLSEWANPGSYEHALYSSPESASKTDAIRAHDALDAAPALTHEIETVSAYVTASASAFNIIHLQELLASPNLLKAATDEWWASTQYKISLPFPWNPSIPIAQRRLLC